MVIKELGSFTLTEGTDQAELFQQDLKKLRDMVHKLVNAFDGKNMLTMQDLAMYHLIGAIPGSFNSCCLKAKQSIGSGAHAEKVIQEIQDMLMSEAHMQTQ